MNFISKIIVIILGLLVCALFILLGLDFANTLFHWWPVHVDTIEPFDKFEVYRDLLVILLATLAVVGYFAYKQVRSKLEDDLQKSLGSHENQINGRFYYRLSYDHWQEYERIGPTLPRHKELCNLAIQEARLALEFYERLDDKRHEGRISYYKMTLAYHLV